MVTKCNKILSGNKLLENGAVVQHFTDTTVSIITNDDGDIASFLII